MGKSRSTTTGQSWFIEQYLKVISGVLFAALALGYATNILKTLRRVFFLPDRVMSVWLCAQRVLSVDDAVLSRRRAIEGDAKPEGSTKVPGALESSLPQRSGWRRGTRSTHASWHARVAGCLVTQNQQTGASAMRIFKGQQAPRTQPYVRLDHAELLRHDMLQATSRARCLRARCRAAASRDLRH